MIKYIIGVLLFVILVMMFLFYQTANCVIQRDEIGAFVDWALIRDCMY